MTTEALKEKIKAEIETLQTIHYKPHSKGGYTAILRNLKKTPSIDTVVKRIVNHFYDEFKY